MAGFERVRGDQKPEIARQRPAVGPRRSALSPRTLSESGEPDPHAAASPRTAAAAWAERGHSWSRLGSEPGPSTISEASWQDPPAHELRPQSSGTPLPTAVRQELESALGTSLETVRIHHSDRVEELGADAFAQGEHVHFAPGRFNPNSHDGRQLLGHELIHVVQQRARRVPVPGGASPVLEHSGLEAEANSLGDLLASRMAHPPARPQPLGPRSSSPYLPSATTPQPPLGTAPPGPPPAVLMGRQYKKSESDNLDRLKRAKKRAEKRRTTKPPPKKNLASRLNKEGLEYVKGTTPTTTHNTPFGNFKASSGWGEGPNITTLKSDFGDADVGTTYKSVTGALTSDGAKDQDVAKELLGALKSDTHQTGVNIHSDQQKRAATFFSGITQVSEESRNPGAGKLARAGLRKVAKGKGLLKKTFLEDYVPALKGGTSAYKEILEGTKEAPKTLLDLVDHMSSSSDEEPPGNKQRIMKKKIRKKKKSGKK